MSLENSRKPQFFILLLIVSFGSVGAVLFTPALPSIQSFFHLTIGGAQLTVTSYLIGYALGQLPYGPLANRFGRKRTLYIGITIAIIGSLLCAFSAHFESFILLVTARFLQALGACVGLKISFTMIADVYEQTESTRMISRILVAFAIMPSIAIAIGGWLTQLLNWQSCFYFLSIFGVFILWLSSQLPETAKSIDHTALNLRSMLQGYRLKIKNQRLLTSAAMMGCGTSIVYIFASKAPFIGIQLVGLKPNEFGTFNLIPPLGMLLGSFLASQLVARFHLLQVLLFGIIASLITTLTMLIPFILIKPTLWSLFLPMILIYASETFIYANISSFGLSSAKDKSNASAVLNFINMGTAVIAVLLTELILPESALLMPLSFLFFFLIMLLFWFRIRRLSKEPHQ
ncbi:MAG: multidrug effflux MFS transporter [Simkania sp.]|nr:multidrug effflux MFS transporter [Simkania sp.]